MSDRYPGALLVSLTMHGTIAGLMFLFAYAANQSRPEPTQVFELVAGEGDNFAATQAPALGEPGAVKLDLPKPSTPAPEPKPQEVAPPEPTPVAPAPPPPVAEKPVPKAPAEKAPPKPADISKLIEKKVDRAETKTKANLAKQREAEQKRLTKEEFDKQNKQKAAAAKTASTAAPKIAKIDTEGIRKGVENGSTNNKTGGAGGKALERPDGPVMDAYFSYVQLKLREGLIKPPGLSDTLTTVIVVRINANGSVTGARIKNPSGSAEFDAAAMAAVTGMRLSPRPDGKSEEHALTLKMKEQD